MATQLFPRSRLLHVILFASAVLAQSSYWLANKQNLGKVAFGDQSYQVFRNVKEFGAMGDGTTDDTNSINQAISSPGNRCGGGDASTGTFCNSTTVTPALIYFPPGTYLVSGNIVMYYASQLVGDAVNPPTIKVSPSFTNGVGLSVFDADIYIPAANGNEWYANQNNFYRQVRNFIFDLTNAPLFASAIHWQVAQATHLSNIVINMRAKTVTGNQQQGIFMENGSGGYMEDITITGGAIGAMLGSQQFTSRNIKISDAKTAIVMGFDWVWLYSQLTIINCDVGIDMSSGGFTNQAVGSVLVIDSYIGAVQGIITPYAPGYSSAQSAGSLMLENVDFTASDVAVSSGGSSGRVILAGSQKIDLFAQGNAWTTAGQALNGQTFNGTTCTYQNTSQNTYTAQEVTIQRRLSPVKRPASLVDSNGNYVSRSKPQYENLSINSFLSAKQNGLVGDGSADDTAAMQALMTLASSTGKVVYFDHGAYIVSSTINIPANVKITGELYSIIMATGPFFGDQNNPKPVWKVGNPGELGSVEISDIIFETKGPTPGAIIVEWNIKGSSPGAAGMWDAHWRIGATAGTGLQQDKCLKSPDSPPSASSITQCTAAFLLLHVTSQSSGYFCNIWGWVSDHELDMGNRDQVTIYNGRGFLIEGDGPTWFYGTSSEHSTLYNYQWANARNSFAGVIQSETAYFQGNPNALTPFTPQSTWNDPTFSDCAQNNCARTWGARFVNSSDIYIYGSGLYNFFENYNTATCLGTESCQEHMVNIQDCSDIYMWALNTKGSSYMIDLNGNDLLPWYVNKAQFCATAILFELASE